MMSEFWERRSFSISFLVFEIKDHNKKKGKVFPLFILFVFAIGLLKPCWDKIKGDAKTLKRNYLYLDGSGSLWMKA